MSRIDGELEALRAELHGILFRPGDLNYDAARAVFNGMIDRRPQAIIRCAGASDVIRGIAFAREHDVVLSVRGGGHSVSGKSVCDGGVMLDLSAMKGVRVDPQRRTARAEPGLTLGELDHETQTWGLATPLGVMSKTGIAGLTLGGGLGWLNGAHGLTCDNLLAADLATADGRLLTASENENDDLFWAIRGGGGNFGVVTSFRYRLHPVGPVLAGGLTYPFHEASKVLPFYDQFAKCAPDELSTAASLAFDPSGQPTISIVVCYCGPIDAGERALHPLRTFHTPLQDGIQPTPYRTLQSAPDTGFPTGRRHYWKSGFLRHLTDEAIDVMIAVHRPRALRCDRRRSPTHARSGNPHRSSRHRLRPQSRAIRLPHRLAMVRRSSLSTQHRMDPSLLRSHAATPRELRLRQQPRRRSRPTRPRRLRRQLPAAG